MVMRQCVGSGLCQTSFIKMNNDIMALVRVDEITRKDKQRQNEQYKKKRFVRKRIQKDEIHCVGVSLGRKKICGEKATSCLERC